MINQEKWIHTIKKNNIQISDDKEHLDYYRWTDTIPKKKNYNPIKKYSIVTILLVFGFLLVPVIKNQTRDLQKQINFLKAEINGIEFNLNQSLLDNEVITSVHYETFLPRSSFPNGTVVVPMDQIGWRSISELMEYTSEKDQHYTNSPKDREMDAWRALETVEYDKHNRLCMAD